MQNPDSYGDLSYMKIFLACAYFLSPLPLGAIIYLDEPEMYRDPLMCVSMITGVCAYVWFIGEFVLIARIPFIERRFGLDRLYRVHGYMALVAIWLGIIHKIIKDDLMGDLPASGIGNIALVIFIVISALAIFLMAETPLLRVPGMAKIRNFMEKIHIANYRLQVALHNFAILALFVLLVHVLVTAAAFQSAMVRNAFIVYFMAGFAIYLYHNVIKRIPLFRYSFIVRDNIIETQDIRTLVLEPAGGKSFIFKPGQFGFLRIKEKGISSEEHPFSFSSSPDEKTVAVTIKNLGDYTSRLDRIQPGFRATIDGPYGRFSHLNHPRDTQIVFIAGGAGITPILSMIRYIRTHDRDKKVLLLWGANTRANLMRTGELDETLSEMKKLTVVPVFFCDGKCDGEKGAIDGEKISRLMTQHGFNSDETSFYICGPSAMLNLVLSALSKMKIRRDRIRYERFSL
jgi:predicted ferric reductase